MRKREKEMSLSGCKEDEMMVGKGRESDKRGKRQRFESDAEGEYGKG